jgi:hypothetical protein
MSVLAARSEAELEALHDASGRIVAAVSFLVPVARADAADSPNDEDGTGLVDRPQRPQLREHGVLRDQALIDNMSHIS